MYKTINTIGILIVLGLLVFLVSKPGIVRDTARGAIASIKEASVLHVPSDFVSNSVEPIVSSPLTSYLRKPTSTKETEPLASASIIDATNNERIKAGLAPLTLNPKLSSSATIKIEDMVKRQYFEHVSPNGKGVSDLGTEVGYNYIIMGENLALGSFVDSDDVVAAWMESPGHRANILNAQYQEIGVAVQKAEYQGREVWFAVQHFGTNRSACPAISNALKNEIDAINKDLKNRQVHIAAEKALLESPDHPQGEEYKEAVEAFNKLVADYNAILIISQEKIRTYNTQVTVFNSCLVRYQSK